MKRRIAGTPSKLIPSPRTSHTALGAKALTNVSKSRRLPASINCRACCTRSGVAASSATSALLCEAFGGSPGLVDVLPEDLVGYQALHPYDDDALSLPDIARRAERTSILTRDG